MSKFNSLDGEGGVGGVRAARWLLKRHRYDGSDTVVARYLSRADAQDDADVMNEAYQSSQYYVEEYDSGKAGGFANDGIMQQLLSRM